LSYYPITLNLKNRIAETPLRGFRQEKQTVTFRLLDDVGNTARPNSTASFTNRKALALLHRDRFRQ